MITPIKRKDIEVLLCIFMTHSFSENFDNQLDELSAKNPKEFPPKIFLTIEDDEVDEVMETLDTIIKTIKPFEKGMVRYINGLEKKVREHPNGEISITPNEMRKLLTLFESYEISEIIDSQLKEISKKLPSGIPEDFKDRFSLILNDDETEVITDSFAEIIYDQEILAFASTLKVSLELTKETRGI